MALLAVPWVIFSHYEAMSDHGAYAARGPTPWQHFTHYLLQRKHIRRYNLEPMSFDSARSTAVWHLFGKVDQVALLLLVYWNSFFFNTTILAILEIP